jgi:hypothetical protein
MKVICKLNKRELVLIGMVESATKIFGHFSIGETSFNEMFKSLVNKGVIKIKEIKETDSYKHYLLLPNA